MKKAILFAALLLLSLSAQGQVLLLDAIAEEPPNSAAGLPRPVRGMTMQQVRARFDSPNEEIAAVGVPPISRWVYPAFTVYFESRYVIDTVVHH